MSTAESSAAAVAAIAKRAEGRFQKSWDENTHSTDRMFAWLMIGQWLFGIVIALVFSPYTWEGKERATHAHVWIALVLGGLIASLPVALAFLQPGKALTRHVVAIGQMLFSALLIHLTGGRIETHVYIFGSLAFLAFYRDWKVLVTATVVIAGDHLLRGLLWPESVYGIANPEWWRFLEHAFYVVFIVAFLSKSCLKSVKEMRALAENGAMLEALSESEWQKSSVLERERSGAH